MSLISRVLEHLNWLSNFLINQLGGLNPFRPKEVNILLLFQDMVFLNQMVSLFGDERDPMNSWVSIIGNIKYKFFYIGGYQMAHRVWRDYGKMDAVVYIVNADALTQEELLGPGEELNAQLWDHFRAPREELNSLLSDEAFAEAPCLIFGLTRTGALFQLRERLCYFLGLPTVTIQLVDAYARPIVVFGAQALHAEENLDGFHFRGLREELDALLSDEAFAEAPFLIFGLTRTGALFQLRERWCFFLGLPNVTIELVDANASPIEVFGAQALHAEENLDGFQWLFHYIE